MIEAVALSFEALGIYDKQTSPNQSALDQADVEGNINSNAMASPSAVIPCRLLHGSLVALSPTTSQ